MLGAKETEAILEKFFNECLRYWKMQNLEARDAFEHALKDVERVKRNPYVPSGDELDTVAKIKFITYREMDLGRR